MEEKKLLENIKETIIDGRIKETAELANLAVETGIKTEVVINQGIKEALNIVGQRFHKNELFIPELALAGEAAKAAGDILGKNMDADHSIEKTNNLYVIGTVYGDLHDIGKNLVSILLKAAGFTVIDLGINQTAAQFVEAVKKYKPTILGLSALLSTTLVEQENVIKALEAEGLRSAVKVMIGGGAVNQDWAEEIGADGYAEDAAEAVLVAKEITNNSN